MSSYLAIIGTNDAPLYELTLTPAEPHLHQFIAFAALDNLTHAIQPYNYCKVIDRFNEYYISAYITHSGMSLLRNKLRTGRGN